MFLSGALMMVYNLIQTVRSPSTQQSFALPAIAAAAGE
jgi:cbb3-type cytochrome oxidase subunit 1